MRQCQTMNPPLVHIICSFLIMRYSMSGVFIAPKSGIYVFIWTLRLLDQSIVLVVNGVDYNSIYNRSFDHDNIVQVVEADESVTGYAIARVNQGEDVFLRTHSAHQGRGGMISNSFGFSTFGGWILF